MKEHFSSKSCLTPNLWRISSQSNGKVAQLLHNNVILNAERFPFISCFFSSFVKLSWDLYHHTRWANASTNQEKSVNEYKLIPIKVTNSLKVIIFMLRWQHIFLIFGQYEAVNTLRNTRRCMWRWEQCVYWFFIFICHFWAMRAKHP